MVRMAYITITRRGVWGRSPPDVVMATQISAPPLLKSTLQIKMGGDNTKNLGNTVSWVDSLKHLTYVIGNIVPNSCTQNCQQQPKKTKVGLLIIETTRKFKMYVTSFLAPITTVLDCSLFAFLTSAVLMKYYLLKLYWYINKLLDSYMKQQLMNNFSLVACTQICHFGSVIPNVFSIYKFVFPLTINAYVTMQ